MVAPGGEGGRAFPAFPYPPYDIQLGFMQALYRALDTGGVGLFESPTGTGKTLSLICGSLQWLQDQRRREAAEAAAAAARGPAGAVAAGPAGGEPAAGAGLAAAAQPNAARAAAATDGTAEDEDEAPDWMLDFAEQQERERQRQLRERQQARIARAKAKLQGLGGGGRGGGRGGRRGGGTRAAAAVAAAGVDDPEAEFLVGDWHSGSDRGEEEGAWTAAARKRSPGSAGLGLGDSSSGSEGGSEAEGLGLGEEEELEVPRKRQIIFASRTHSQLTQFVGELHRTSFADELSLVALGSRKALCINDAVLRLQSAPLISERCLEMQKPGSCTAGGRKAAAVARPSGGDTVGPQRKAAGKAGMGASGRCPYLACGSQAAATTRDMILAQPMDIEGLAKLGRRKSVCPYYSARRAVPEADIILAPYSCLLVREAREALGLRLEGNVVIVDEGHNLVDAINGSHSAELSAAQAATAQRQLSSYFQRFQPRLAPANCRHIQMLLRVAQMLSQAASGGMQLAPAAPSGGSGRGSNGSAAGPSAASSSSNNSSVLTVNDFLLQTGLDNLNLFKLVRYLRESKLVYKVAGFWQSQQKEKSASGSLTTAELAATSKGAAAAGGTAAEAAAADTSSSSSSESAGTGALHALVGFLQSLTNADADGRIVVQAPVPAASGAQQQHHAAGTSSIIGLPPAAASAAAAAAAAAGGSLPGGSGSGGGSTGVVAAAGGGLLKFVLFNAAAHFGEVVSAAHAVVLASGTLSPLQSVLQLFPGVPPHRLHRFECGHVVAQDRLLPLVVGSGPSGAALDFRHSARGRPATIDELGRLVLNACQVMPGGVVVFFPSFSYAEQVHSRWQHSGMLRQLAARKRVFREPRLAGQLEACLQQYADCIAAADATAATSKAAAGNAGSGTQGSSAAKPGGGGSGSGVTGAVMLCVVGGKLAEGINFGDALGRCVIMVGLPYPNPSDPELQERMSFKDHMACAAGAAGTAAGAAGAAGSASAAGSSLATAGSASASETTAAAAAGSAAAAAAAAGAAAPLAPESGRDYYSNLCMKAVNQCVGRVIRHRADWAAVLLVDARYAAAVDAHGRLTGPLAKLPGWIQRSLQVGRSFGDAFGRLARFSRAMAAADSEAAAASAVQR